MEVNKCMYLGRGDGVLLGVVLWGWVREGLGWGQEGFCGVGW